MRLFGIIVQRFAEKQKQNVYESIIVFLNLASGNYCKKYLLVQLSALQKNKGISNTVDGIQERYAGLTPRSLVPSIPPSRSLPRYLPSSFPPSLPPFVLF